MPSRSFEGVPSSPVVVTVTWETLLLRGAISGYGGWKRINVFSRCEDDSLESVSNSKGHEKRGIWKRVFTCKTQLNCGKYSDNDLNRRIYITTAVALNSHDDLRNVSSRKPVILPTTFFLPFTIIAIITKVVCHDT